MTDSLADRALCVIESRLKGIRTDVAGDATIGIESMTVYTEN